MGESAKMSLFVFSVVLCSFLFCATYAQKTQPDRSSPPEMGNGVVPPPSDRSTWSMGFGTWTPMYTISECSAELHNKYWVRGPDGKVYHTWHPTFAVENGKRCFFGHEHGDDPSTSNSFRFEPIPFGYVNEVLGGTKRHEDHVGHKVSIFNDATGRDYSGRVLQTCDTLIKVHMGTHSNDAFVNSAHEVFIYANCDDGRYIKVKTLHVFGPSGFRSTDSCQVNNFIPVDTNLYPSSVLQHDLNAPVEYMASRGIPYKECIDNHILQPPGVPSDFERYAEEHWRLFVNMNWVEGQISFQLNPYLHVFDPIRYYDPNNRNTNPDAKPPLYTGYFVDLCYLKGDRQINAPQCNNIRDSSIPVTWNSRKSPFLGVKRDFGPNGLTPVVNKGSRTTFWTDVFLLNPSFDRPGPNEARIEQVVKGNSPIGLPDLNYARTRGDYSAPHLHAPN